MAEGKGASKRGKETKKRGRSDAYYAILSASLWQLTFERNFRGDVEAKEERKRSENVRKGCKKNEKEKRDLRKKGKD